MSWAAQWCNIATSQLLDPQFIPELGLLSVPVSSAYPSVYVGFLWIPRLPPTVMQVVKLAVLKCFYGSEGVCMWA